MANPKPAFELDVSGIEEMQAYFKKLTRIDDTPVMRQAMVDGAMVMEEEAKKHLQEMIYDKGQTSWYRPKHELYQKTIASSKVKKEGSSLVSSVISAAAHAIWVHFGTGEHAAGGKGRKGGWLFKDPETGETHFTRGLHPRPYMTRALQTGKTKFMAVFKNIFGSI